ncbi:MAG: tetratricopeptide repeat protein [Bacteroidota bacterium]
MIISRYISFLLLLTLSTGWVSAQFSGSSQNTIKLDNLYIDACTHMIRGDYQAAIGLFKEVLEMDPKQHASMYHIAKLSVELRNYEEAVAFGKKAISLAPENLWYYTTLRQSYELRGNFSQALKLQEEIVKNFKEEVREKLYLVELYARQDQEDKAIKTLLAIEKVHGPSEIVLRQKYKIFTQANKPAEALSAAERLLGLNDENPVFYQMKFDALTAMGRSDEAVKSLEGLLEIEPDNGFALLTLADYYKNVDDIESSDKYLFRAFRNPSIPADGKVKIIKGLLSFSQSDPTLLDRVNMLSGILADFHPEDAGPLEIRGDIFALNGDMDSSHYYYKASLTIQPARPDLWLKVMYSSFQNEKYPQLYTDAEDALSYYPNNEEFLLYYGIASLEKGSFEEAEYAFKKVIKLSTSSDQLKGRAYQELSRVYNMQGNFSKSQEILDKALAINPEDPYTLNAYAYALAEQGKDLGEASSMIKRALSIFPEAATIQHTQAWIYYQQSSYKKALDWIEKATRTGGNGIMYEHYGDILHALGRTDEAVEKWNLSIQKGRKFDIDRKMIK